MESGSGIAQPETFIFNSKLYSGGRSFRFRNSFAFNEQLLNIQKHRAAVFRTRVQGFLRRKLGRLVNFLITHGRVSTPAIVFPTNGNKGEEK